MNRALSLVSGQIAEQHRDGLRVLRCRQIVAERAQKRSFVSVIHPKSQLHQIANTHHKALLWPQAMDGIHSVMARQAAHFGNHASGSDRLHASAVLITDLASALRLCRALQRRLGDGR